MKKFDNNYFHKQTDILNIVLDHITQGMVVVGPDYRIRAFNRYFEDMFQLPPDTVKVGADFREILKIWADETGQDQKMLNHAIDRLDQPTTFEVEFPQLIQGVIRWCLLTHNPLPAKGFVRTFTDITERKKSEAVLLDIIDKNPISMQILDIDGFTLSVNPAHTKLFGSVPPSDYCLFTDPQLLRQGFGDLLLRGKRGKVVQFPEFYYNAHDFRQEFPDMPAWIRMLIFPLIGSDNKPERFVLMHENITERKRTEDQLKESEAVFRSLFEDANDPILLLKDGRFTDCNVATLRLLGYDSKPELLDRSPSDISPVRQPDGRLSEEKAAEIIESALRVGSQRFEWLHTRADGTSVPVEVTLTPITVGKAVILHTYWRDITDRKKAAEEKQIIEQQLQHTQKLESLGVLSGGIAHDFNNILAIIMGYCALTKMNYETAEKNIPEIEKATERAAGLCRQMLAYAGKAHLTKTRVNMVTKVGEIVGMLKSTLPQNAVINTDLSAKIPLIEGDASQLRQVVMNLIINASEAIGTEHGEVNISLARINVIDGKTYEDYHGKAIPTGEYVCLEVTDNGCGMDEATKWRIFEPFFTTKFTGRGLGMSAVLGIIKSHGGALQLFSQPAHGTTFKVYLPAPTSDTTVNENQTASVPSTPWQGSGTILLAEDEDQVRLIAKALLQNFGFTVLEAVNGKEALEMYKKNSADITLVFTDIGMPVMDGYELFNELKKIKPELPIIVSSGYGNAEVSSRIGSDKIAGLISKPYNPNQLREVLKRLVEGIIVNTKLTGTGD